MELPNLTITFLIEYNNRFLLISRGKHESNFPSLWAFPGGKVEIAETAIETIRREVKEETGLSLTDECCFLDSYFFKKTVGIAFLVRATTDVVKTSNEISEYKWVASIKEMTELKCIPGIHNHLERALELLHKGQFDSLERMNLIESKYLNK